MNALALLGARSLEVLRGFGHAAFFFVDLLRAAPAALRRFAADEFDIESLAGLRIRVRGWIKSFNGPMIDATHPEQIEVLGK